MRSLVQKRKADELNAAMKAKSLKKIRKPSYHSYQKQILEPEWKKQKFSDDSTKTQFERQDTSRDANENDDSKNSPENSQDSVINVDKDDSPVPSVPIQNQLNPAQNQSAFYPYVDPLHFFIDLRVSAGQIYDRKKEAFQQALKSNNSGTWNNSPIIAKNRAGSAFKVPSSFNDQTSNFSAMNLITSHHPSRTPESLADSEEQTYDLDVKPSDNGDKRND